MRFFITQDNIIQGTQPLYWNSIGMNDTLAFLGVSGFTLPETPGVTIVNTSVQILPVIDVPIPTYNSVFFHPAQPPTLLVTPGVSITRTFGLAPNDIGQVKTTILDTVNTNSTTAENAGLTLTIQGQTVQVSTKMPDRFLFSNALQMGQHNIAWNFGNVWLTLTNSDIQTIATAITNYVQSVYNWQLTTETAINDATSVVQLSNIPLSFS